MPSQVVTTLNRFRRDVLAEERQAMILMARRWASVEAALLDSAAGLAADLLQMYGAGIVLNRNRLMQLQRTQRLLAQARVEVNRYARWAERRVAARQRELAGVGIEAGAAAIRDVAANLQFDRLPVAALEHLIGLTGDGSPLREVLEDAYGPGAEGILDNLVRGAAQGKGPREIARMAVQQGLSRSLDHMLIVARSEPLRVYRHATLEAYRRSRVVHGYYRLAAKSARTCVGCLAMDGQFFLLEVDFEEHANGRCTAIPAMVGYPAPDYERGGDWFARQNEAVQREMLGPTRFELYRRGLPLDRFVARRENARWGGSYVPATLREVLSWR